MKKMNKKGFTIVELVIVIAVIAILASVLIPTFANVVEKANESKDLQAARNAMTAILLENNGQVNWNEWCIEVATNEHYTVNNGALTKGTSHAGAAEGYAWTDATVKDVPAGVTVKHLTKTVG